MTISIHLNNGRKFTLAFFKYPLALKFGLDFLKAVDSVNQ